MLEISNLNFEYKNKPIFKGAKLQIPSGGLHIIIGPNGAGKTTLLKILCGNIKTECKIQSDFKDIFYLPQNPYYPKGITTFDYISSIFFKDNFKWFLSGGEKKLANEALLEMELFDKRDLNIESLSAGELQKANIALGLLSGADLFLLDEPLSNMDLINQVKILRKLKALSGKGITCVVIMHDLNMSLKFGDSFIGIGDSGKILKGSRDEIFTPETLKSLYNIDFEIVKMPKGPNDKADSGADEKIYVQITE